MTDIVSPVLADSRPPTTEPWWRTPWVALPILAAAGGLGLAAAAVAVRLRQPKAETMPSWCRPGVGQDGGQLEGVDYIEIRTGGAAPNERLPMVIALHSRGMTVEKMAEFASHLPGRVRVIVPQGFEKAALGRAWTTKGQNDPAYSAELQDVAAELISFIDGIRQCRPTVGKPVVAGYSAGADLAFALAADASPYIAGAVGAAGWVPPDVEPIKVPTSAVHGRDDKAVPYERTSLEVATRIGKGQPLKMVPLESVGHSFAGALQLRWLAAVSEAVAATSTQA